MDEETDNDEWEVIAKDEEFKIQVNVSTEPKMKATLYQGAGAYEEGSTQDESGIPEDGVAEGQLVLLTDEYIKIRRQTIIDYYLQQEYNKEKVD